MKNGWIVAFLTLLLSTNLFAQTEKKRKSDPASKKKPAAAEVTVRAQRIAPDPTVEIRLNTLFFGNFFQAPEGVPEEDVMAAAVEGRFTRNLPFHFRQTQPVQGYLYLDYLRFDQEEFGGSPGLRVGARSEGRPHGWDAWAQLQKDRPAFDVGDQLDQANIARLAGDYSYRLGRNWQFGTGFDYEQQSFDLAEQRDNNFLGIGGTIRYRGFGSEFSPEIGFALGDRSVDDSNEDYGQTDWILQIRSAPSPPLYLSVRYRHRVREYDTSNPSARNFGREDTRDQIVLGADLRSGARLTWNLYLAWENADSTSPSRVFDTLLATFGLSYRIR
jgi:hypothetical protein